MRIALSTLLGLALCLPAYAQRGPGGRPEGGRPGDTDQARELRALTERLKALEAQLKAQEGKKEGEQKVEVRVVEAKDGDKKPDGKKDGDKEGVVVVRVQTDEKKDGDKKPEGPRGSLGIGNFSALSMARVGEGTPPGFEKLNREEQAQFRKLTAKMRDGDQPRAEVRVREVRREGGDRAPQPVPPTPSQPSFPPPPAERREGGERRPNLEERMERIERAIEDIRSQMKKK